MAYVPSHSATIDPLGQLLRLRTLSATPANAERRQSQGRGETQLGVAQQGEGQVQPRGELLLVGRLLRTQVYRCSGDGLCGEGSCQWNSSVEQSRRSGATR